MKKQQKNTTRDENNSASSINAIEHQVSVVIAGIISNPHFSTMSEEDVARLATSLVFAGHQEVAEHLNG